MNNIKIFIIQYNIKFIVNRRHKKAEGKPNYYTEAPGGKENQAAKDGA